MYTLEDNQELAEEEFDGFAYSVCLKDANGNVQGLFVDEAFAKQVMETLNNALNPHEKD